MFALSVEAFDFSAGVRPTSRERTKVFAPRRMNTARPSWLVTNKGLQITLPALTWMESKAKDQIAAQIQASVNGSTDLVWLLLEKDEISGSWGRANDYTSLKSVEEWMHDTLPHLQIEWEDKTIYLRLGPEITAEYGDRNCSPDAYLIERSSQPFTKPGAIF